MNPVLSISRPCFFYLFSDDDFSFESENFLKSTKDIAFKFSLKNDLRRNVNGLLINPDGKHKFVIELSGKGILSGFSDRVLFVSSAMKMKYGTVGDRKIIFNYVFSEKAPVKNELPNVDQALDQKRLFCIPIVDCYVAEKVVSENGWCVRLEEI